MSCLLFSSSSLWYMVYMFCTVSSW